MLRNYPSLLFYCGGNELYPSNVSPPPDIATDIPAILAKLDPGRYYIRSSMTNWTDWEPGNSLAPKDGPYGFLPLREFYRPNPGLKFWNGSRVIDKLKLGFQPEIGSASCPVYESLRRFLGPRALSEVPCLYLIFVHVVVISVAL
jgi:hypothetical protein